MRQYLKALLAVYVMVCTFLVSIFLLLLIYGAYISRTVRAPLQNGLYLNRAHPFSDQIVLRAPDGTILLRDIAHVLFNDRYVAGEIYGTSCSTERFVYRVGDGEAVRDSADRFEAMLDASGLADEWPWGPEDPNWLDFNRLLVRLGIRSPFPEEGVECDRHSGLWHE